MRKASSQQLGFTIVELLVVIVVIGILAAVTVVSYTGISQRAIVASLQSDLSSSTQQLKMFNVDNGSYPIGVASCPTPAPGYTCLKFSSDNQLDSYDRPTPQTFILRLKNGSRVFVVTENSAPGEVAPLTAIAVVSGTPSEGSTLTAGALTPTDATAAYQWQSATTSNGTYADITGATSSTYIPVSADVGRYLKVVATGNNSYFGTVTSAPTAVIATPWIGGLSGTLVGKYVYNQDLGSTYTWGPDTSCPTAADGSQPCKVGLDTVYTSQPVLVSPQTYPAIDFSPYPAQNACKVVGGRLPTFGELIDVLNGRASYGNNFPGNYYRSAVESSPSNSRSRSLSNGYNSLKSESLYVRCVKG